MVVDASAAASWFLASQATPSSKALRARLSHYETVAPVLLELEIRNVMLLAERRGAQTQAETDLRLGQLFDLIKIRSERLELAADRALPLARETGLKLYDAIYLDMALGEGRSLATRDGRLIEAAKALSVDVHDLRG